MSGPPTAVAGRDPAHSPTVTQPTANPPAEGPEPKAWSSESKPAARARGGHPLKWLFIFFTKLETHLAVLKLYFFFKLKGGFQVGANPPTHSECYIFSLN